MDEIRAKSKSELFAALKKIDMSVPRRSQGRKTEHIERWSICHFLSTFGELDFFDFPLLLRHRDRPDFRLEYSHQIIGIEVTEATKKEYAEYQALLDREFPNSFGEPSLFKDDAPKLKIRDYRKLLAENKLHADGWEGDSVEQEWAKYTFASIIKKTDKLRSPGFIKYPKNWLLIYDNLPIYGLNREVGRNYLFNKLKPYWKYESIFTKICIDRDTEMFCFEPNEKTLLKVNNVWL